MKTKSKFLAALLAVMLVVGGCAPAPNSSSSQPEKSAGVQTPSQPSASKLENSLIVSEDDTSVTFVDCLGKTQTIEKNPQRVVVAYNSLLDLWYLVGERPSHG